MSSHLLSSYFSPEIDTYEFSVIQVIMPYEDEYLDLKC